VVGSEVAALCSWFSSLIAVLGTGPFAPEALQASPRVHGGSPRWFRAAVVYPTKT
jgi:hypothetical protein